MRTNQKRFLILFLILTALILLALIYFFKQYQNPKEILGNLITSARAQTAEEFIEDFQVEVLLNKDGSAMVTEKIDYNFGPLQRHGIYREIPYKYSARGGLFTVKIEVLSVVDENGVSRPYTLQRGGGYLNIKIGEADKYVTGSETYIVKYSLNRVINFFETHDEFYWNVTGNSWDVSIDRSGIIVKLPDQVSAEDLQAQCFTGGLGSEESDCQVTNLTNSQVGYTAFTTLAPEQGLTVVLGWPKGLMVEPNILTQLGWIVKDNPFIFLPLIILFFMILLWYNYGRDFGKKRAIIAQYESPHSLTPVEVGSLIDETVNLRDISATFIDLAVRGYLKIKQLDKKDWLLIKIKEAEGLNDWEKEFYNNIFGNLKEIKISELKKDFYQHLPKLKREVYKSLVKNNFFPASPARVRNYYLIAGLILFVLGSIVMPFVYGGFINILALIISAVVVIWLGQYMPRKTAEGLRVYQEILGYKLYLKVAEKARLDFHNAPVKTPELFEKHLPYAMALEVEKKWAKKFETIYVNQPSWYEGNYTAFNAMIFMGSLNSFSRQSTVALSQGAQAAGGHSGFSGGFSGGGFGGGGGGSW